MRCSAWSSLAISVCSALVFAGTARAHVVISPGFVVDGETATLSFSAPNERKVPMTGITVNLPSGVAAVSAKDAPPWRAQTSPGTVTWSGGRLPPGTATTFALDVAADAEPGTANLVAEMTYPDGESVQWPLSLTVLPPEEGGSQHLGLALVAGIFGLLGVTGAVLLLGRRRSRSPRVT